MSEGNAQAAKAIEPLADFRYEHQLAQVLDVFGLDGALDGKNPMEVDQICKARVLEIKSQPREYDVVNNIGPVVNLGGKPRQLWRIPCERSQPIREKLDKALRSTMNMSGMDENDPVARTAAFTFLWSSFPALCIEVVREWTYDLPWDDAEGQKEPGLKHTVADFEILACLKEVLAMINPYPSLIAPAMKAMGLRK